MDKITIIGGQRKWYQPVADELGFKLIHNGGESHRRILSDLKRSSALVMVLEATSHKATYVCVEAAKECGIPIHRLKGCKKQLKDIINNLSKE